MRAEANATELVDLPGGARQRIQMVTAKDLAAGPNLGIVTGLDILQASDAARL
jgi:site-specific DNA-methyltransferase (adenine-specific)